MRYSHHHLGPRHQTISIGVARLTAKSPMDLRRNLAMNRYIALIDGAPGAFGVTIPDLPGAFGTGDSVD